jgi:hypothetical protein
MDLQEFHNPAVVAVTQELLSRIPISQDQRVQDLIQQVLTPLVRMLQEMFELPALIARDHYNG